MSVKLATAIAFKIFALYILVQVILGIPQIWGMYESLKAWSSQTDTSITSPYIIAIIFLLFGLFISFLINKIANNIISSTGNASEEITLHPQTFILQILGMFLVARTIPILPSAIVTAFFTDIYHPSSIIGARLTLLSYIFILFLGMALLIKPKYWQQLLTRFRAYGS